jgi:hypothetical protein
MTRHEHNNVVRVIEALVAPQPPLPPVRETDAVAALERSLAAGPKLNAVVLRTALLLAGMGMRRGPLAKVVASLAHLHYYGDDRVMRLLGYDPDAVLARAAEARSA